jgi:hypothetical protein
MSALNNGKEIWILKSKRIRGSTNIFSETITRLHYIRSPKELDVTERLKVTDTVEEIHNYQQSWRNH